MTLIVKLSVPTHHPPPTLIFYPPGSARILFGGPQLAAEGRIWVWVDLGRVGCGQQRVSAMCTS